MTNSEQKLRKANKELKDEVAELKVKLEKVLKELSERTEECKLNVGNSVEVLSPDKTKSVEFVSDQYDDLIAFKVSANKELEEISARLDKISETCDRIQKLLDAFELYSYQFNIKIVGMPMVAEREHPEQTVNLCLQLFSALGVKGMSIQDIDTAHRVPSMKPSNRPKAIICKFVRRLAKDQVMATRKKVGGLKAEELGFAADINVKYLNIYDHLTPRLQALYHEAKKVKEAKKYKFCWAKNGLVYLRKSEESTIYKFADLSELNKKFSTASEAGVNDHLQS